MSNSKYFVDEQSVITHEISSIEIKSQPVHSKYRFHDLRTLIINSLNILNNNDTQLNLTDISLLRESLNESLNIIKYNESLDVSQIMRSIDLDFSMKRIYLELSLTVKRLKVSYRHIKINLIVSSNANLYEDKSILLCDIISKFVKFSITNGGSNITIKCYEIENDGTSYLICDLSDNKNVVYNILEFQQSKVLDFYSNELIKLRNKWKLMGCGFDNITITDNDTNRSLIRLTILKDENIDNNITSLSINQLKLISSINKKVILIVDDSFLSIKIMVQKILYLLIGVEKSISFSMSGEWSKIQFNSLELDDYYFIFCHNGRIGYDVATIKDCHLIISDIEMPIMDGIEMVNKLFENGLSSKIVISSSHTEETIKKIKDISPENFDILPKGCSNDEYINVLKKYF